MFRRTSLSTRRHRLARARADSLATAAAAMTGAPPARTIANSSFGILSTRRPMALDANRPDLTVGIVGTGAMGRGIAQVAAAGGINVLMTDARPGAAHEAREFIAKMLARAAEKGTVTLEEADVAVNRIRIV